MSAKAFLLAALLFELAFPSVSVSKDSSEATVCAKLVNQRVTSSAIRLPTAGATIKISDWMTQGSVAFCRVIGAVSRIDPAAPDVLFEVNLPSRMQWNAKAIQYGGGGLNGTLISGLKPLASSTPNSLSPLEQGYVTFGTDGGHETGPNDRLQAFAGNDEALRNHAYGAYIKVHDVAFSLLKAFYNRKAKRMYFIGSSEGGREALGVTQLYPNDYDGVMATVPVLDWVGVNLASYRNLEFMRNGGWLSPDKVQLLYHSALDACDQNDGLKDGVIARYQGCDASQQLHALRCVEGALSNERCLTDQEIAFVELVRSPMEYGYAIRYGETSYPGFPTGGEGLAPGFIPFQDQPMAPAPKDGFGLSSYSIGDIQYFFTQDPQFSGPLDLGRYRDRIQYISSLMDMNNPDLAKFRKHGGKLILVDHGADFLVAPASVYRYFESVVSTMGIAAVNSFMRFYVAPNLTHVGTGSSGVTGQPVPSKYDELAVLDDWVEHGVAPPDQITLKAYSEATGAQEISSWPMCRYPKYPQFISGDAKLVGSYACKVAD